MRDTDGVIVRDISGDALKDVSRAGINRIYWDLRHAPLPLPRAPLTQGGGATLDGPFVLSGEARVTLTVNGRDIATRPVKVNGDMVIKSRRPTARRCTTRRSRCTSCSERQTRLPRPR